MNSALVPYKELEAMAADVVRGGLFPGIKTVPQALTLFLVAQAEGLHPMTAAMRYNVIQNRPALKADAMLASFMERGGTVKWVKWTDDECEAVFKSAGVPDGVTVRWTMADASKAGVTANPTWKKYPRQMLKARVASDGVRMADPSVNYGRYTPEEVQDFDEPRKTADAEVVGGEPVAAVTGVSTEPAPPAIQSAEGLSTEEYLEQAKRRSGEAIRIYMAGSHGGKTMAGAERTAEKFNSIAAPPPSDADAPFEVQLEKVREKVAKKIGRPKSVPEFCYCDKPVIKYEATDGKAEYWECAFRHAERHKMAEQGESKDNIREALKGHIFKWAGKPTEG